MVWSAGPRRPVRAGGVGQDRPLPEEAATHAVRWQRHPPEAFAVDAGDVVVPGEPLVEERIVGVQQVEHAAILADENQPRFSRDHDGPHCRALECELDGRDRRPLDLAVAVQDLRFQ